MSVTDKEESTSNTEDYQSGESCSSNKESRLLYLKIAQTKVTSFQYNGEAHTVANAKPEVFDAFISEVVEEIINVDRERWDMYDRWNVINECLQADVLTLTEVEAGSLILAYPEVEDQEEQIATEPLSSSPDIEKEVNDVIKS